MFAIIPIRVSIQNTFGAVSQRKDDSVVEFWQCLGKSMKQTLKNIAMTVHDSTMVESGFSAQAACVFV